MILTFIDKDFKKQTSFEIKEEENQVIDKQILSRIIYTAINELKKAGIKDEDIRVIDWVGRRLFHLKDFTIEKVL